MQTTKPRLFHGMLVASILALGLVGRASSVQGATATGYTRPVNVAVLSWFLYHTYENYSAWGTASFGGSAGGGYADRTTGTIYGGESTCMNVSGNLTYAVTGVCHQGTNRGLYETSIPYVNSWGDVMGSGTSNALWCTFGAGLWCYGAPC